MIKEFVERWDKYKGDLENYFKNTNQEEYSNYGDIVKALFKYVINREETKWHEFNLKSMKVIDDGDYQGTQIFIIPLDVYQPDVNDYVITNTYYGSCSGCDTLLAIRCCDERTSRRRASKRLYRISFTFIAKM